MPVDSYLIAAGALSAVLLISGLVIGIAAGDDDTAWRIWPAPPAGSLKSFAFWTLFRTLNVAVLVLAIERLVMPTAVDRFLLLRLALIGISLVAFAAYLYALWALGRAATYCRASGLATEGVYRWTRNPQYATAIAAFAALALALFSWQVTPLAMALVTVYALMALAEEPWLEARYGNAYAAYRAEVPRFFNYRHALHRLATLITRRSKLIEKVRSTGR
jgi:protein-S-isoprenylcysteine O-methyltransferase Ste14